LLRALATGDRTFLEEDVRGSFSRAGVAHLLAVSGLHVGWVFAVGRIVSGWLLKTTPSLALLRRATTLSMVTGTLCALGYALLTGPGIPALRASAMAFAGTLAVIGGRRAASWNGLVLAVLVVVALEPASVFAPAFQLSFAAVSGIILWHPKPAKLHSLLHCTLAASLATAPFVALLGAPLPLAGLLANLIAVPLFGAALVPLALAVGMLAALTPSLGELPLRVAHLASEMGIRLVGLLESPDLLAAASDRVTFALGLAAAGFGLRLLQLGRRVLAAPVLLAALVAFGVGLTSSRVNTDSATSLLFLDVGHGDSILVRSGTGAWLIDAGPQLAGFDAGRYVVVPALRAEGVRRLNALVLTHSDRDHVGGAVSVLRAVEVDELWMSRETLHAVGGGPVRRQAARSGIPIRLVAAGDTHDGHGLKMSVLWPPLGQVLESSNRASLVLRISSGERCAMLPGDVPVDVERALAQVSTPCEVLKLSHHGSASSSAAAWLEALAPRIAVVSAGRRARSPLPHPLVRRRVREAGIELWETSRSGAIRIGLSEAPPRVEPFLRSGETRR
jgi:competence protein ComEC